MKRKNIKVYFGESVLMLSSLATAPKGFFVTRASLAKTVQELIGHPDGRKVFYRTRSVSGAWTRLRQEMGVIRAAGGWVINPKGQYLFIFRRGKWDLPKGKMEKAESPRLCALREVEEECGVSQLKITGRLPDTFHTYLHKGRTVIKVTHWYRMSCHDWKKAIPQTEEDITAVKWMSKTQVRRALKRSYASLVALSDGALSGIRS